MNKARAAAYYAELGLEVFACQPRSKAPATPNGFYDATTDKELIARWWWDNPSYNPAIRTGQYGGRWLVVVDVDNKPAAADKMGAEEWLALYWADFRPTWAVRTGSGGRHFYYWSPVAIPKTLSTLAVGIDVCSSGGYVLAPGSVHPAGGVYRTMYGSASTIATISDQLTLALTPSVPHKPAGATQRPAHACEDYPSVETLIKWAVDRVRGGAGRNDTGFKLAQHLLAHDCDSEGFSAMLDYQAQVTGMASHPYTVREAEVSWKQAQHYPRIPPWTARRQAQRR